MASSPAAWPSANPTWRCCWRPTGFRSICTHNDRLPPAWLGTPGVQYLMWATENESDLQHITQRLRAYDTAVYSHTENGVTFLEGCDPTGG